MPTQYYVRIYDTCATSETVSGTTPDRARAARQAERAAGRLVTRLSSTMGETVCRYEPAGEDRYVVWTELCTNCEKASYVVSVEAVEEDLFHPSQQ